jgi:hypothetical protein
MIAASAKNESSSQRKLGSILIPLFTEGFKVRMDPSLRWDDVTTFHCREIRPA